MKAKKQLLGFTAASLTLGAVFMAGGAPIPFYHTYAETLGLDKGVLSLVTVAYFAGTVIASFVFAAFNQLLGAQARNLFNAGVWVGGLLFVRQRNRRMAYAGGALYAGLKLRAGLQHGGSVYY